MPLPPPRRRKICDCHLHPSLRCYKAHFCGCAVCRDLNRIDGRDERLRQKRIREEADRIAQRDREVTELEAALRGEGPEPRGRILSPEELTKLRRAVGIIE